MQVIFSKIDLANKNLGNNFYDTHARINTYKAKKQDYSIIY